MASFSALDPFKLSAIKLTTNKLGTGSYASVYEVNYLGLKCAGKKIHEVLLELEQSGEATYALTRFAEECRLLSRMRHPNIVQFLGVYFEKGMKVPVLIMEFLPTNLSSCIEHNGILRSEISYSILHDVSLGLNYLHSHSPPIIHRDLSSNNVLLAASMKAKISDLGVAKILNLTPLQVSRVVRNTETPGTGAYMPPEAMIANPTYNTSIDVFSYGVLMIHVFSGQWPEPQCGPIQVEGRKMIPKSEADRRQKFLDMIGEKHPLMDLILRCIDIDPKRRPSANEVVPHLNDMVTENPPPFSTQLEMLQRIDAKSEELQLARQEITKVEAELQAIKDKQQATPSAQPQQHVDTASQEEKKKMTLTLSHNNGVDPRALDDDRLMQQAKEQSEVEYLKGALNTQVVNREEQIRALNEIEKAQTERRHKLLQNITDRGQRYEPISGFPGQPSNQQPHPQHSSAVSVARPHHQPYESPDRVRRDLMKLREQHSVQDELGYHRSRRGKLVVPEPLVSFEHGDAARREEQKKVTPTPNQSSSVDPRALDDDRLMQQAKEQSEVEYLKGALNTQVVNREEQIRALNEIERRQNERRQKLLQNITDRGQRYEPIPGFPGQPSNQQPHPQHSSAVSGARPPHHAYEPPDRTRRDLQKMREQRSVQDEQLLGYHGSSAGGTPPLHHQRSMPNAHADAYYGLRQPPISAQPPQQFDVDKQNHTYSNFPSGLQQTPLPRQQEWRKSDPVAAVAYASEEIIHQFKMGSTVELLSDPPRYGVIRWIFSIPNIQGRIAGVELEEPMEGCGDGLWKGVRYFSCRQGHCFFCPLASLRPDQRFAGNPLDHVALEEEKDQHIILGQIKKYIGAEKGIQGQQNSCYLDSTLFGLFAVSDAFDNIFLQKQQGDPAGDEVRHLLWKGIVNPLRKNGVVRYESVMRLRYKLEELGKMKGVNQDEKDPEEFLNMLFKHTLHMPPFINIRRPYGVEQEYFVQLFVEPDDSLKLPTVEDLLARMFKEQKIRFTKVPPKLLIQIPRYGREFKTCNKTIPNLELNLKGLLSSKHLCFYCGDCAWKECSECKSHFTNSTPEPSKVVYFCEGCAKLAHGKTSGRDKHRITDVAPDSRSMNDLDLLSVICIETSHYICFTRSDDRWVFFDSMANRVNDMYYIPKVVDCTDALNEWVYPASGDLSRLINTPPRELPEYVRRFTQDIYLCVYIQPDVGMYGDFEDEDLY